MLKEKRSAFCAFFGFCMFIVLIVGGAMVKRRAGKEEQEMLVHGSVCTIQLPARTRQHSPSARRAPTFGTPPWWLRTQSRGTTARVSRMHSRACAGGLMY